MYSPYITPTSQAPPQQMRGNGGVPAYAMSAYSQVQTPNIPPPSNSQYQAQTSSATAVLYYSNYCNHCNFLLRMIASRNLKAFFALVCVDHKDQVIPDFVQSVPMAFVSGRVLGGTPRVLSEGSLLEYIERCAAQRPQQQQQPQQQPQPQHPQQQQELAAASCAGGDAYSFLNDHEGKAGDGQPGRSSTGSFFYELNPNGGGDVDFRIEGMQVHDGMQVQQQVQQPRPEDNRPLFLEPFDARQSSQSQKDLESMQALRKSEEDAWKNQAKQRKVDDRS